MSESSATIEPDGLPSPPAYLNERYRLIQWLGQGSMGLVYRVRDEVLGRDVAIKFLLPKRLASSEARERFLREARAMAQLSHPNIVALYDAGQEANWHYLVMEHIPGHNLHARLIEEGQPLSVLETLRITKGVLAGLAFAHAQNLVHRDIKPENVLLTPQAQIKVTDFGLALANSDVRLTQDDLIVGTVLYLAPEVIAGQTPDSRADLYAVGAVMYEMLTGQPPVQLTPREREVIRLLTEGLSNKEIARLLSVSPRTVNFHLDNIYAKLGVNSRTEAAIYALRQGWGQTPV